MSLESLIVQLEDKTARFHLALMEDGDMRDRTIPDLNAEAILDLNAPEEINVTQNAPTGHV